MGVLGCVCIVFGPSSHLKMGPKSVKQLKKVKRFLILEPACGLMKDVSNKLSKLLGTTVLCSVLFSHKELLKPKARNYHGGYRSKLFFGAILRHFALILL